MNPFSDSLLAAGNNQQIMAIIQSACSSLGEPLHVHLMCRTGGPLLLEISSPRPDTGELSAASLDALTTNLGGINIGVGRSVKLIPLPADFRCPGRDGEGGVIDGCCYKCRSDLLP